MEDKFMGHAFLFYDGETEVVLKNNSYSMPWVDLTELYFNFLQASGYNLTRQDFAETVQYMFRKGTE